MNARNKLALSPVPTPGGGNSGGRTNTSFVTKDYLDAIAVLNEDLMNQACELLLLNQHDGDDDHGQNDDNDPNDIGDTDNAASTTPVSNMEGGTMEQGTTSYNKRVSIDNQLLEMYNKCEDALKVIKKHQPPSGIAVHGKVLPPGAPSLSGPMPAPRILPRGSLMNTMSNNNSKMMPGLVGNSKLGVVPIRRTALNKAGINLHNKIQQQQQQQQQFRGIGSNSNNSGDNLPTMAVASSYANNNSKKQRLSPPPPETDPNAPPPSALDFLARLNKETPSSSSSNTMCSSATTTTTPDLSSCVNESKGCSSNSSSNSATTTNNSRSGGDTNTTASQQQQQQQQSDPPKRKNTPRGLQKQPPI